MKTDIIKWQLVVLVMITAVRYWDVMHGAGGVSGISMQYLAALCFGSMYQRHLKHRVGHHVVFIYWLLVDIVFSLFVVWVLNYVGLVPVL